MHQRIDVHQHVLPPAYAAWLRSKGIEQAGGRDLPEWSVNKALHLMQENDIASAILPVSTPGVHIEPGKTVDPMARDVNGFSARLAQDHPDRFGFFATLTLPDVDGALDEAGYALDRLGACGVILLANTHGDYLGGSADERLLSELNRRHGVIFVHPSTLPGPPVEGVPPFAADFLLDRTRAAYRLVQSGAVRRYPNLKIILSHAGGFVPYASHRMAAAISGQAQRSPVEVLEDFRRFCFDTALSSSPAALPSLLAFAKPGHVLFGSDWPFAPDIAVRYFTSNLDAYPSLADDTRAAIDRRNAQGFFPRFDPGE